MSKRKKPGAYCARSDGHRKCGYCGVKTCEEVGCPRLYPEMLLTDFPYGFMKVNPRSWYERKMGRPEERPRVIIGPVFCDEVCEVKWRLSDKDKMLARGLG